MVIALVRHKGDGSAAQEGTKEGAGKERNDRKGRHRGTDRSKQLGCGLKPAAGDANIISQ